MGQRRDDRKVRSWTRTAAAALVAVALIVTGLAVNVTAAVAAATVTVTPSTGLTQGQIVTISGSGWAPDAGFAYCQTAFQPEQTANPGLCHNGTYFTGTADSAGNISGSLTVRRLIFPPNPGGRIDCSGPDPGCAIGVSPLVVGAPVVFVQIAFAPAPPVIVPSGASALEENAGTTSVAIPVALSYASDQSVTAQWTTWVAASAPAGQADPASDYSPASGTLTFSPGETSTTVPIEVNGDVLDEPDEYILILLTNPTNATIGGFYGLGFGGITNDDHATVLPGTAPVLEGSTTATDLVPVTLSNPSTRTITVDWTTLLVPGAPAGLADPTTDYTPASGTVTFAPGETATTVPISVSGDTTVEPDEYIVVSFTNPTNAQMGGYWGLGFGLITNDDT
jgi:hypothetical protein